MDSTNPEQLGNMPPSAEQAPQPAEQKTLSDAEQIESLKSAIKESRNVISSTHKKIQEMQVGPAHQQALNELKKKSEAIYGDFSLLYGKVFNAMPEKQPQPEEVASLTKQAQELSAQIQDVQAQAEASAPAQPDEDLLAADFSQVPDQRTPTFESAEKVARARELVSDMRESAAERNEEIRAMTASTAEQRNKLTAIQNESQNSYLKLTELNAELLARDEFDETELTSLFNDAKAQDEAMMKASADARALMEAMAAAPAVEAAPPAAEPAPAPAVEAPQPAPATPAPAVEAAAPAPATPMSAERTPAETSAMMTLQEQVEVWKQAMKRLEKSGLNPETKKNAENNLKGARQEYVALKRLNESISKEGRGPAELMESIITIHESLGGKAHAEQMRALLAEAFPAQGHHDAEGGAEVRKRAIERLMQMGKEGIMADIEAAKRKPSKDRGWMDKLPYLNQESALTRQKARLQDELRGSLNALFDYKSRESRIKEYETNILPLYERLLGDAQQQEGFDAEITGQIRNLQDLMLERFEAWKKLNSYVNGLRPEAARILASHPDTVPDGAPLSAGEKRIYLEYKGQVTHLKSREDLALEALKRFMGAGPQNIPAAVDVSRAANESAPAEQAGDETESETAEPQQAEANLSEQESIQRRSDWQSETSDKISAALGIEFPTLKGSGDMARLAQYGLSPELRARLERVYANAERISFSDNAEIRDLNAMRNSVLEDMAKEALQKRESMLNALPVAEGGSTQSAAERADEIAANIAKTREAIKKRDEGAVESAAEKEKNVYDSVLALTRLMQDNLGNQRTSSLVKHKENLVEDMVWLNVEATDPREPIDDLSADAKEKLMTKVLHVYESLNDEPYRPAVDGIGAEYVQKIANTLGIDTEDILESEAEKKRRAQAQAREVKQTRSAKKPAITVRRGGRQRRAAA